MGRMEVNRDGYSMWIQTGREPTAEEALEIVRNDQRYRRDGTPVGQPQEPRRYKTPRGHNHVEAFCLMWYASDDGSIREQLWNSRDGVTPFTIMAQDGATLLRHVDWQRDEYRPEFKPPEGMRLFIDCTPELAQRLALEVAAKMLEDYPDGIEGGRTLEELAETMYPSIYGQGDQPYVYP